MFSVLFFDCIYGICTSFLLLYFCYYHFFFSLWRSIFSKRVFHPSEFVFPNLCPLKVKTCSKDTLYVCRVHTRCCRRLSSLFSESKVVYPGNSVDGLGRGQQGRWKARGGMSRRSSWQRPPSAYCRLVLLPAAERLYSGPSSRQPPSPWKTRHGFPSGVIKCRHLFRRTYYIGNVSALNNITRTSTGVIWRFLQRSVNISSRRNYNACMLPKNWQISFPCSLFYERNRSAL